VVEHKGQLAPEAHCERTKGQHAERGADGLDVSVKLRALRRFGRAPWRNKNPSPNPDQPQSRTRKFPVRRRRGEVLELRDGSSAGCRAGRGSCQVFRPHPPPLSFADPSLRFLRACTQRTSSAGTIPTRKAIRQFAPTKIAVHASEPCSNDTRRVKQSRHVGARVRRHDFPRRAAATAHSPPAHRHEEAQRPDLPERDGEEREAGEDGIERIVTTIIIGLRPERSHPAEGNSAERPAREEHARKTSPHRFDLGWSGPT
jgi:hypothetical protein